MNSGLLLRKKFKTLSLPGKYLSLSNKKCIISSEGQFRHGSDLGRVEFNIYGIAKHYIIPDSTTFDITSTLDFFINDKCIEILTNSITGNPKPKPSPLPAASIPQLASYTASQRLTKSLYEILGVKQADKLISEMSLGIGIKHMPAELKKTLFFTDINMKWVPSKSCASKGKIGIGNIYSTQMNKYVEGYIVLKKRKNGNEFTVYLQTSPTEWFLFDYDCRKRVMLPII